MSVDYAVKEGCSMRTLPSSRRWHYFYAYFDDLVQGMVSQTDFNTKSINLNLKFRHKANAIQAGDIYSCGRKIERINRWCASFNGMIDVAVRQSAKLSVFPQCHPSIHSPLPSSFSH
ncbi:hypothetical protein ECG_04492 [Echinococcus granulosus]|uniref:Uncharacterized protein n=1 Tax=Echinococcus granulosus TaxID=6210 RepID=A0A068WI03_ECHGR|nr:hypothetical protein ECG_04492 [Echinococcus granulosus]CDS17225.1 hypothetical protein EgrG_000996200 [Echinococcus granulosus]